MLEESSFSESFKARAEGEVSQRQSLGVGDLLSDVACSSAAVCLACAIALA